MSPAPAVRVKNTSSATGVCDMATGSGKLAPLLPVAGVELGIAQAGIKQAGRDDVLVVQLAQGSELAAVFTQNTFCAAPVSVAKAHLGEAAPRYLLVNTGNANAGTGEQGLRDARRSCEVLAAAAEVDSQSVLPFSTGVIGEHLPMDTLLAAIPAALTNCHAENWQRAASAILTTDTRPKGRSLTLEIDGKTVTVTGIAKGSGMIRPNMATMLAYVATDARVSRDVLQTLWRDAVNASFNRITVDGDTSTNDAAVLISTGKADNTLIDSLDCDECMILAAAITELAIDLAQQIVRDGEGASKFVTVRVAQGRSEAECEQVAFTVAHSPLVKTALFASDANWGRVLAAVGRAGIADLDGNTVSLLINDVLIAERGARASHYTEEQGAAAMACEDIELCIRLGRGEAEACVWTTDLSHDYVSINADYRS